MQSPDVDVDAVEALQLIAKAAPHDEPRAATNGRRTDEEAHAAANTMLGMKEPGGDAQGSAGMAPCDGETAPFGRRSKCVPSDAATALVLPRDLLDSGAADRSWTA
jgi:hypothetical protein